MRGGGGGSVVGYHAQAAVDARHKLIAAAAVTHDETAFQQLAQMAVQAKDNLGVQRLDVVADRGYCNNAQVSLCEQRGSIPYLSKADPSANTQAGLFGKSRFTYVATKDVYVCPAGRELTHRFNTEEKGRSLRYYRARDCRNCALKKQCTRNQANRTITREEDEHLMEAMVARVRAHPEKMRLRKALCEHPFGTLKRWFGYTGFLMKGLAKVRCECSLMILAYNLKRVLKLVSIETDGGGALKGRGFLARALFWRMMVHGMSYVEEGLKTGRENFSGAAGTAPLRDPPRARLCFVQVICRMPRCRPSSFTAPL
jgi:hypothetical protein